MFRYAAAVEGLAHARIIEGLNAARGAGAAGKPGSMRVSSDAAVKAPAAAAAAAATPVTNTSQQNQPMAGDAGAAGRGQAVAAPDSGRTTPGETMVTSTASPRAGTHPTATSSTTPSAGSTPAVATSNPTATPSTIDLPSSPQSTTSSKRVSSSSGAPGVPAALSLFSNRVLWDSLRRAELEGEVRELLAEARAWYRKKGGAVVLQVG